MPIFVEYFISYWMIWLLVGWSIYIVYRCGQIYNPAPFVVGLGAYFTGYALREWDWPFALCILASVGLGMLVSFIMGKVFGRAPAFTVAIALIAVVIIFQQVAMNLQFIGGASGLFGIPSQPFLLPIAVVAVIAVGYILYRMEHSYIGRAMDVTFVSPNVAASMSIDVYQLRIVAWVFAGALCGLAGALYVALLGTVYPGFFGFGMLILMYCFLFVGGYTTMWGLVAFVPLLWAIPLVLPKVVTDWKVIIYASLLITILIVRSEGAITRKTTRAIATGWRKLLGRFNKKQRPRQEMNI